MSVTRGTAETGQSSSSTLSSDIEGNNCFVTRFLLAESVTVGEFTSRIVY